jgi:hypothetical protein
LGLSPLLQDAGLRWLKGIAFPAPPAQLWLALHRALPASSGNEVGSRVLVDPVELGEPRAASRDPLPQVPFVPGNGELRDLTNLVDINSDLLLSDEILVGFSFWDAASGGTLVVRGALQESVTVAAGDVFVLRPGQLLIRFTAP